MLKCLEEICDYINRAAYAYIAVSGGSFCESAYNGMLLNLKHGLAFAWANMLAKAFVFLGKAGIVALNCFSCYGIMKYVTKDLTEDNVDPTIPLTVVAIATFIVVNIFLGLFDETVAALLTCVCIDRDLHGAVLKFGPPTFHNTLGKLENVGAKKPVGDVEMQNRIN